MQRLSMTAREGGLDAPTRHPLDWRSEAFQNEAAVFSELERVYEICHGCRRCVNLCTAFPRLFDLIDESATGELASVDKSRYWEVVDRCYLCDLCYMTKCPYVPPHPWAVDFPQLQLRAKSVKFRKGNVGLRDRVLSSTDAVGKLATIPVVVEFVNAAGKSRPLRALVDRLGGIHKARVLPEYTDARFRDNCDPAAEPEAPAAPSAVEQAAAVPEKVALFASCYVNYNEPQIGHDLLAVLAHNGIPTTLAPREVCCGMPKLELGDLEAVAHARDVNVPILASLASQGYALMTAVPSCTLMFKQQLRLLFPDDDSVRAVAKAMFDPFEYLMLRYKQGRLRTDFRHSLGRVSYHVPCHLRVQNMGQKTRELLAIIPGTSVTTVERCSGHDGTWGIKSEYFDESMKIGRPVFRQMAEGDPDYIASDCAIAARHIEQGMNLAAGKKRHPLSLLRLAYGI
jgi:glycerol-3-phosphate dehydrogenase subunit C